MADKKTRHVEEFTTTGVEGVQRAFGAISDSFGGLLRQMGHLTAIAAPVTAALGSIGGALTAHKVLEVGKAYENVQTRMAGTLAALNFAPDFTAGLDLASHSMDKIYAAAAKLPGEAEDYIEVFTQGLPVMQASLKGGLDEYLDFSNRFTAVAKSLQIDTAQAAGDMQRLLAPGKGSAGLDVKTWTRILPFMKQVQGQANLTAESFNKMSDAKRADILGKGLMKLDPMVKQMATSWDAVEGAIKTAGRDLMRIGTASVFKSMKTAVQGIADSILDSSGQLTRFGRIITNTGEIFGKAIGQRLDMMSERFKDFGGGLAGTLEGVLNSPWAKKLDQMFAHAADLKDRSGFGGEASGFNKAAGAVAGVGVMAGASALLGPLGAMLVGPIAGAFGAAMGPAIGGVLERIGFEDAFYRVVGVLKWFEEPLEKAAGVAWSVVDPLVQLASTIGSMIGSIFDAGDGFKGAKLFLDLFITAVGDFVNGSIALAEPLVRLIGAVLVPTVQGLALALMGLLSAVGALTKWIGDKLGLAAGVLGLGQAAQGKQGMDERNPMQKFMDSMKSTGGGVGPGGFSDFLKKMLEVPAAVKHAAGEGIAKGAKPPANRPTGHTVQDFRGSRFTIQQDFAKNFDPDRIAVAFAKDVEKIGASRLQSGFEPLFGVS